MTEQHPEPGHGEQGHVCRPEMIDVSDALVGIIIREDPEEAEAVLVHAWSNGPSKRMVATMLRDLADGWDEDADAEEADDERAAAAELN